MQITKKSSGWFVAFESIDWEHEPKHDESSRVTGKVMGRTTRSVASSWTRSIRRLADMLDLVGE